MAGLVPAISLRDAPCHPKRDRRDKPGDDSRENCVMPSLIGTPVKRLEDEPLLRGQGRFVDDIALPGVWHAAFVRSPHPHALITSIDKTAALAVPGVHAVLTLDDLAPVLAERRM